MSDTPKVQPCPDCGGTVSLRAPACPHCGAPLADNRAAATPAVASPTVTEEKAYEQRLAEELGAEPGASVSPSGGGPAVLGSGEGLFMQTMNVGCLVVLMIVGLLVLLVVISVATAKREKPTARARLALQQGEFSQGRDGATVAVTYRNDHGIDRTINVTCTVYDVAGDDIGSGTHTFPRVAPSKMKRATIPLSVQAGAVVDRVRCRDRARDPVK